MERLRRLFCREPSLSLQENLPKMIVLTTLEQMKQPDGKIVLHNQRLVQATIDKLKLVPENDRLIRFADSRRTCLGRGLEECIMFKTSLGQNVFIFDSDHLTYPYLVFAVSRGMIQPPFRYIHVDTHIDMERIEKDPPRPKVWTEKEVKEASKFFTKYLAESNFVTAMIASGLVDRVEYITFQILGLYSYMVFAGRLCEIEAYGANVSLYPPFTNRLPKNLFKTSGQTVLAFDLDFFGAHQMLDASDKKKRTSVTDKARIFAARLKKIGYSQDKVPIITIATSPGFNDGYKNEEEKLKVAKVLVEELAS